MHQRVKFLIQQVVLVSIFSTESLWTAEQRVHIQAEIEVAGRQKKPDVEHQVPFFVLGSCVFKFRLVKIFFFTFATTVRFFPPRKRKLIEVNYHFLNFAGCSCHCLISAQDSRVD